MADECAGSWRFHLEQCVRTACLLEATARKPGNVHPQASFADLCYADFVRSAEAVSPALARTEELGVGRAVLDAVVATQAAVGKNTNLGIVLLIAPLAAVPEGCSLASGIEEVLAGLSRRDAALVYRAIRAANPGGMGEVAEQDLSQEPTGTLVEVMQLAADRDAVARQYATRFEDILDFGVHVLSAAGDFETEWEDAIIELQLRLMVHRPDTLIARKCGEAVARESSERAQRVLDAGGLRSSEGKNRLAAFDQWLRADGHTRNPGTTADLVTATLFAALRDHRISAGKSFVPFA